MNKIFKARQYFQVPDGTEVSPFLNATDVNQRDVPWGTVGEMSIAAGRIGPGTSSRIHVHPALAQVTYLLSGGLRIRMKDADSETPYDLDLQPGEAVLTEPGTLFQLRNTGEEIAEVLYIVSPSYVFEMLGEKVVHDDAILVAETWDELMAGNHRISALDVSKYEAIATRAESMRRLAARKGRKQPSLAEDQVLSLQSKYDYLAPDGSEIRELTKGQNGGFAHCILPAGSVSAPVRHRTVEELWYVLDGEGEIWRSYEDEECIDHLQQGFSVRIPVGASFQFRASKGAALKLLLATMPPWPGPQEAVPVTGKWPGT